MTMNAWGIRRQRRRVIGLVSLCLLLLGVTFWYGEDIKTASTNSHQCKEWFHDSFEDNLDVIANYPRGNTSEIMMKLFGNATKPATMVKFPVIVTAANTKYFHPSQGLLKNIDEVLRPKYPSLKIIYYDLGLKPEEHAQVVKYCRCEVRYFRFNDTPQYLKRLNSYTWKPVVVKTTLMEFGFVWWLDTSIRFKTADVEVALEYAKKNGFLVFSHVNSLAYHTDLQTFDYLGEDSCKFREFGETQSGNCLFLFGRVTDIVVNAWVTCALVEDCMYPPGTAAKKSCTSQCGKNKGFFVGCCHRYDQSVLGIIHRRLNHSRDYFPARDDPVRRIWGLHRYEKCYYFPNETNKIEI